MRRRCATHGIAPIDLLVVNLYPFEATVAKGAAYDDCVENIDIGGPAMIRAAAKNHDDVAVVVDPDDYAARARRARRRTTARPRSRCARRSPQKAYARTAAYDAAISNWFAGALGEAAPAWRAFGGRLAEALRYGENPHQTRRLLPHAGEQRFGVATARQVQGKQLSYNNINDTDAAYECVAEFDPSAAPPCAIVKHANPCGVAEGAEPRRRLPQGAAPAIRSRPSAASSRSTARSTRDAARAITEIFTEVIIAPDATEEAIAIVGAKKNLRLLLAGGLPDPRAAGLTVKSVAGGLLVQSRDNGVVDEMQLRP